MSADTAPVTHEVTEVAPAPAEMPQRPRRHALSHVASRPRLHITRIAGRR